MFFLYTMHLPPPPAPSQGPPSPLAPGTPQMPDSLVSSGYREAHVVVHIPHTLEIAVINSDDERIENPKEDPEADPEFEEHQIDHEVKEAKSSASDSSFDSGEETEDESDPNYNPFRDH